jgi:Polyketide cyclase / dehydrase and lipid transport
MKWVLRITGGFVSLIVIAVALLFALGHRANAGRVHVSSDFNAPAEQLWPWLTDSAKVTQWVSSLVEIREDKSKTGVGAKEVWVMRDQNNFGQPMEIEGICTEYVPLALRGVRVSVAGSFDGRQTYRIENLGNGRTRLNIDGQYHFSQWFAALLEPLITPAAEKKLGGDVARLKSLVESGGSKTATR